MGLLDDLEFLKKQRKPNLLANTRQLQRPVEPYLRQQYPEVYGAFGGLLGMAPDEMAGSVLDPNTARVRAGAEYGFPVGTATQMLPMAKPAQATAMAAGQAGERLAERVVPRVMERGGMGAEMLQGMSKGTVSPMDVYHGSPYKFDRFDASKIGTGEGAQAYGHGLYFAENPAVAQTYSAGSAPTVRQQVMPDGRIKIVDVPHDPGFLYKVDLPDEQIAKMLDYDKPLSAQSAEVQAAMAELYGLGLDDFKKIMRLDPDKFDKSGQQLINDIAKRLNVMNPSLGSGAEQASKYLRDAGIPGVKYLDEGSRTAGKGTRNFVIFPGEEEKLRVLGRAGH